MQNLTVKVRRLDRVSIHDAERADSSSGKIQGGRTSQATGANYQD